MKKHLIIVILGKPGSGKGTQAELLKEKFGLKVVSSGNMLRARKKIRDFTGKKIQETIDRGNRVPTPVIARMWLDQFEEFKKNSNFKGFILEGSPRTALEAEMVDEALDWYEWLKNKEVFFLYISQKQAIWRLSKRKQCSKCGQLIPFIGKYREIKKCDKCGGELFTRKDDTIEGIKKRLAWFETDVMPVIRHYKKKGQLITINGEQSIEDVFKDILKAIK
ncbi:MAG: nucleoside monophosphate kinase [Candidatus Nealsonbacteria bacterium]